MIYAIEVLGSRGDCTAGEHVFGLVKFGKANDPESRLKVLATASPYPLRLLASVEWTDDVEGLIHRAFGKFRVNGEWFEASNSVQSFVSTMMCPDSTEELKYAACMQILAETLSGGYHNGTCQAPSVFDSGLLDSDV